MGRTKGYVKHPLIREGKLESRLYQETILQSATEGNLLCVLPTGLGKTAIAITLAAYRMEKYPSSKVMILSPTKPLTEQHYESFSETVNLPEEDFAVVTGQVRPEDREEAYRSSRIIFATPQTVKNDLENRRLSIAGFSLIVFDEAHHAVGSYAYPYIAREYGKEAENGLIIGLTASPGGTKEKITEIMSNLGIERVEIRTESDHDVRPWIKKKEVEWLPVKLPPSFDELRTRFRKTFDAKVSALRKVGFTKPSRVVSRKDLLQLNRALQARKQGPTKFWGLMAASQAIKTEHALTLLETQGIPSLHGYFKRMKTDKTRSSKILLKDGRIRKAMGLAEKLRDEGYTHPKISKLCEIVSRQFAKKPDSKVIIFANYRSMVEEIVEKLSGVDSAEPVAFVGQKDGITQKEQKKRISDFREGRQNVLVTTSVGEEGIDIPEMELAVFYEPVPSEIRAIQRRGRVGRTKIGRIVILMTKGTRDEAYYWVAHRKERNMKRTLYDLSRKPGERMRGQLKLEDF